MEPTPNSNYPMEISVTSVKQMIDEDKAMFFVDCREQSEFDHCCIDSAMLIPMNQTPENIEKFREQEGSQVIVFCHHGGRSYQVAQYLRSQGIENAQSMAGGIDVWSVEVDSSILRY